MVFNICAASNWRGITYAVSEDKARSNLAYQAKKLLGKAPYAQVTLPGKLTRIG